MDVNSLPISGEHKCPTCGGGIRILPGAQHNAGVGYFCSNCRKAGYVKTLKGISYEVPE